MTKLDQVLDKALEKALSSLEDRLTNLILEVAELALREKVKALFEEPATPTFTPTVRAKAKAAKAIEATPEGEEASPTPAKARRRKKGATQAKLEEDLTSILDGVKLALQKYGGVTTPRGKPLPEVLYRRVRKVLEHAQTLGRHDLPSLAGSVLAHIHADPRGIAMGSWQNLAARVGLPIPLGQE